MSPLDIIPVPGHDGMYARRAFVEAWQRAGSPRLRSAGRLYREQKDLYDGYRAGRPGFNPADNPDDETQRLAHVRFVAGDIANPTPEVVAACKRAGLVFPYSYEPWHGELPGVYSYPIVRAIPAPPTTAGTGAGSITRQEEDEMGPIIVVQRHNPALAKGRYIGGGRIQEITKHENTVLRAAQDASPESVLYVTVPDVTYAALVAGKK